MQTFLRIQPRIESFLNKDASLSIDLRSNQLNNVIIRCYDIELPVGLIQIIIEYENNANVIHHQYQQYVAPKLLHDHYPRSLLTTYKFLNYTSSIVAITASFFHLYRWLNQAASTESDALPSTANITTIKARESNITPPSPQNDKLPKFLTFFPIPGSLTLFNNTSSNLFSTRYSSLYPSLYRTIPIFAGWTTLEFLKNIIFFNTNRNIQKLSYFMPVDRKTKSITDSLFNDWNELFYADNYGLCPKRYILSYTNDIQYLLNQQKEEQRHYDHDRLIIVDEFDNDGMEINFDSEYEMKYDQQIQQHPQVHPRLKQQISSQRNSIIVPNPKYTHRNNKLPLPSYKHFLLQSNTLYSIIMLHCTLLPISRALLQFNHLFLPNNNNKSSAKNKRFANLQSITSHRSDTLNTAATKLMKFSHILLSHTYCLLHVVSTSIVPVIGLRSVIFGNISNQLQNILHPMHLNNNANAANAALAQQHNDDSDSDDDDIGNGRNNRSAFEEYIDKWSLSNHLTSISLMLSMIPYVNNFYAMMSVFSFGMTLGEGEDIMRWTAYRLLQNNMGKHNITNKINKVWYTYYVPWLMGVIGITCSFTIEVWASSNNIVMANRFKRISLICLMLSICLGFGNRSYLETGFYLRYKSGRNLFEKLSQYAVEMELGIKEFIKNIQNKNRRKELLTVTA